MKKLQKSKYVQPVRKEQPNRLKSLMPLIMIALLAVAIILAVVVVTSNDNRGTYTSTTSQSKTQENESNGNDAGDLATADVVVSSCYADIEIENYGTITVFLDADSAPMTVSNFVTLAKSGFYDGLTFHRIMEGFMMQGGDPNGDGTGNAGKTVEGEFAENGFDNPISHVRGVISMARAKAYNSASCQFFIVHEDSTESLDGKYAAFGHVISGMEVVDEICETVPQGYNGATDPDDQPIIKSIKIRTEEKK